MLSIKTARLAALANILGCLLLIASLTAKMTVHPLTPRIAGGFHIVGLAGALLMLASLTGLKFSPDGLRGGAANLGYGLLMGGLVLLSLGDFNYAFFHSFLQKISTNDPLHAAPLFAARLLLCAGSVVYGLAVLARRPEWSWRAAALVLILGALIYLVGYQLYGDTFFRQRNLSRHLKASLIVDTFFAGWIWISLNSLRPGKTPKTRLRQSQDNRPA